MVIVVIVEGAEVEEEDVDVVADVAEEEVEVEILEWGLEEVMICLFEDLVVVVVVDVDVVLVQWDHLVDLVEVIEEIEVIDLIEVIEVTEVTEVIVVDLKVDEEVTEEIILILEMQMIHTAATDVRLKNII